MSDFKAKMYQFRLGLRPRSRWGSLQRSPRPPSWIKGAILLRGREGNGIGGKGKEREEEGGGREGKGRGGGTKGKGGDETPPIHAPSPIHISGYDPANVQY